MRWEVVLVVAICTAPISLPLASFLVATCYAFVWGLYLLYGSKSLLERSFPPISPIRVFRIIAYLITYFQSQFTSNRMWTIFLQWTWTSLMHPSDNRGRVKKNIQYGETRDATLDVYAPRGALRKRRDKTCKPNAVFVLACGSISSVSKSVGIPLAQSLQAQGYTVVLPQYSRGTDIKIGDLVNDLSDVLDWTSDNISRFGGDPSRIYLMGYSTGALVCNLLVLNDASRQSGSAPIALPCTSPREPLPNTSTDNWLPRVYGMILFSGIYDLLTVDAWLQLKGMDELHSLPRMMDNPTQNEYEKMSPVHLLFSQISNQDIDLDVFCHVLPRKWIFLQSEGDRDKSHPPSTFAPFVQLLASLLAPNQKITGPMTTMTGGLLQSSTLSTKGAIHLNPLIDLIVPSSRLTSDVLSLVNDFCQMCEAGGESSNEAWW